MQYGTGSVSTTVQQDAILNQIRGKTFATITFEFDGSHTTTNDENVSLVNGAIGLQEIRLKVHIKEVTSKALHSVINRKNMNPLAVFDIRARSNRYHISQSNPKVVTNNPIHSDFFIRNSIIRKDNANSFLPLLALENNRISLEEL